MADQIRSIPIRPEPIAGEALDSWLETLGHRLSAAWGDVMEAVGLPAPDGSRDTPWLMRLTTDQAAAITAATGIAGRQLHAMTLSRYDGSGIRLRPGSTAMDRAFPWGRSRFSRYCPHCLRTNDGRWQLFWRLGWAFVCETHQCLLVDECPECRQRQRENPIPGDLIPTPGHCMTPGAGATGRAPVRCNADLTGAPTTTFPAGHRVLRAQQHIKQIIETGRSALAIYADREPTRVEILADIRALANRILGHATGENLQQILPADLYEAHQHGLDKQRAGARPGQSAPTHAATAAVGTTAALDILTSPDIESAAKQLRWLITLGRDHRRALTATTLTTWGRGTTATLTGIQLAALGSSLKPSDQLRYRIGSKLPAVPDCSGPKTTAISAKIPHTLWNPWSLRLCPPHMNYQNLAAALSCAVHLVGTRASLDAATAAANYSGSGRALSHVLQRLEEDRFWDGARTAIIGLADYLHTHDVPINYQRRRGLDYRALLTGERWNQICQGTGTATGGARKRDIVRCHLYTMLTGSPVDRAPWFSGTNEFISCLTRFPAQLTSELADALDTEANAFLKQHNVFEPTSWYPPLSLLDGLDLPGTDPESLNIAALHTLIRQGTQLGHIAQQLNTTVETVRYALTSHPVPQGPLTSDQKRVRGLYARDLRKALPRRTFYKLYITEGLSLREIAARYGVERKAVTRLARHYGIQLRPARRPRIHEAIEREWLYTEYVTNRRALPELAAEKGMSTANMARWAKTHQIELRGRGGAGRTAMPPSR